MKQLLVMNMFSFYALEKIKKRKNELIVIDNEKKYTKDVFLKDVYKIINYFNLNNMKEEKILIDIPKSYEYLVSFFALLISKNTPIPVDNKKTPESRKKYIIKNSGASFVLNIQEYHSIINSNISCELNKDLISNNNNDLAYIIYTSGSTGLPKGVLLSYKGILNVINSQIDFLSLLNENVYWFNSTAFDASISDILCSIFSNSTLYINDKIIKNKRSFTQYCNKNLISYIDIPPSYLSILDIEKFFSLKKILIGGETFNKKTIEKILSKNIDIYNVYGPTEATICTSIKKIDDKTKNNNIGKPINGINYEIINGELVLSGDNLAKGYINIISNKFRDNKFYTGDLSYYDDDFYFLGRYDRQVKINGQMVCPEEIESMSLLEESNTYSYVIIKNSKIHLYLDGNIEKTKEIIELNLPTYMRPHRYILKKIKRNTNLKVNIDEK